MLYCIQMRKNVGRGGGGLTLLFPLRMCTHIAVHLFFIRYFHSKLPFSFYKSISYQHSFLYYNRARTRRFGRGRGNVWTPSPSPHHPAVRNWMQSNILVLNVVCLREDWRSSILIGYGEQHGVADPGVLIGSGYIGWIRIWGYSRIRIWIRIQNSSRFCSHQTLTTVMVK